MRESRFEIGLIRVITCAEPSLGAHGRLIESAFPELHVESLCIPDQPEGLHSCEMETAATPKIAALARSAFAEKDAILVSCAEDPGCPEIRAALPGIPVMGAGEAACSLAIRRGQKVGVLGITDDAPKAYVRMLGKPMFDACGNPLPRSESGQASISRIDFDGERHGGMGANRYGSLVANIRPHGVSSTLDLQTPEGRAACIDGARLLRRLGADVIALGCTGMATIGIAPELEEAAGLPVVDPVLAMGSLVAHELRKKRARTLDPRR